MKYARRLVLCLLLMGVLCALSLNASALEYSFEAEPATDYYPSTSYSDVYGSRYNYGGKNLIEYQIPEIPYGVFSTTQTGVMEKVRLPYLQQAVMVPSVNGGYGITGTDSTVTVWPDYTTEIVYPGFTEVTDDLYYSAGHLGRLVIPELDLNVKIFEGTSSTTLAKGIGHFKETSIWDGNVALAAHNRGANNYFGQIHNLDLGDKIKLTTKLGTREYEVVSVAKVDETDRSGLVSSAENMLTLYTCVRNQSTLRWCVQAVEVE